MHLLARNTSTNHPCFFSKLHAVFIGLHLKLYRQIGASLGDTTLNTTLSPSFPGITCEWLAMAIQAGQHPAVM